MTRRSDRFDIRVPAPSRRYDALLGGKDNFAVDRRSAYALKEVFPAIEYAALENRKFLRRAVRYLAATRGIRQFLDVGVGLPNVPNVHDVAQDVDPACRVVYVDCDPLVAVHARALLVGTGCRTRFVHGDLRRPEEILSSSELRGTLNLCQPVALILAAVLHFCTDDDDPYTAVRTLTRALPVGSFVVLSHATFDPLADDVRAHLTALAEPDAGHGPFRPRRRDEVAGFLDGLKLEEPGLVSTVAWHPDSEPAAATDRDEAKAICYAAVGRLP